MALVLRITNNDSNQPNINLLSGTDGIHQEKLENLEVIISIYLVYR